MVTCQKLFDRFYSRKLITLKSVRVVLAVSEDERRCRPGESDTWREQVQIKTRRLNQQVNHRGGVLVAWKTRRSRRRRRRRRRCRCRGRPYRSSRRSAAPLSVRVPGSGYCASPCVWWLRSTAARCPSTAARGCSNWSSEVSRAGWQMRVSGLDVGCKVFLARKSRH